MSTAQQAVTGTSRGRSANAGAAKTPRGPSPDRKRFSFGPVWNAAVIAGKVTDHDKLVAQAVKLKIAAKSDAKRLKFATLLAKVQAKLKSMPENERPADDSPTTKQVKSTGEGAKGKAKVKASEDEKKAGEQEEAQPAQEPAQAETTAEAPKQGDDHSENAESKAEAAE